MESFVNPTLLTYQIIMWKEKSNKTISNIFQASSFNGLISLFII